MGKPFTELEAALLLDAFLKVQDGVLSRAEAVRSCSAELRRMAVNSGDVIDDSFRRPDGIASQMEAMESAYKGRLVKRRPTKLFTEIANLFWNDNERYQNLLNEAKVMAKPHSTSEETFLSWLSERIPNYLRSTYYLALKNNVELLAKGAGIIKASLYDEIDLQKLERIRAYVVGARSYKLLFKREKERVQEALDYLAQYLREKEEQKAAHKLWASPPRDAAAQGEAREPSFDAARGEERDEAGDASLTEGEETRRVLDFAALDSAVALPKVETLTLSYFGEKKAERNWTSLYVDALSFLCKDYSLKFAILRLTSLNSTGKSWLVDEERTYRLTSCAQIADDYFVETGRSELDLLKNLKWILDQCAVDYENVVAAYTSSEPEIEAPQTLAEEEGEAEGVEEEADVAEADEEDLDDLAIQNDDRDDLLIPRADDEATDEEEEGDDEIDDLELDGDREYVEDEDDESDAEESEELNFFSDLFDETSSAPTRDSKDAESRLPAGQATVDFENLDDMRFTRPIFLKYFEDEPLFETTWKEVLVDACRYLFKDYASKFLQMRTESVAGQAEQKRIWLADEAHKNALREPREIVEGFYVETNYNASRIVGLLKRILDRCDVDYKNLTIIYVRREKDASDVALLGASIVAAKEEARVPRVAQIARVEKDASADEEETRTRLPEPEELMDDEPEVDYELVDFENLASFAFTKPIFLRYFGRKHKVETWRNVLLVACRLLYGDNPDLFEIIREDCVSGDRNPLIADVKNRARQIASKEFVPGYFIETNFSAIDALRRLKWLLDECGVAYQNVAVAYVSTNVAKSKPAPKPELKPEPAPKPVAPSPYRRKDRETFQRWLVEERGLAEEKAADLASCVERAENLAAGFGLASTRLYTEDVEEAKETEEALFANPLVVQFDEGQNRSFRDAIAALMEFYGVGENETPKRVSVVDSGFRNRLENGFKSYLISQTNLADKTVAYYCRSVEYVEQFLSDNGLNYSLDSSDTKEVERIFDVLRNREDFVSWNFRDHHRYSSAVAKYADYLRFLESGGDDFSEAELEESADISPSDANSDADSHSIADREFFERRYEEFKRWLCDEKGYCERFADHVRRLTSSSGLFTTNHRGQIFDFFSVSSEVAIEQARKLLASTSFVKEDRELNGRFGFALAQFVEFCGGDAIFSKLYATYSREYASKDVDFYGRNAEFPYRSVYTAFMLWLYGEEEDRLYNEKEDLFSVLNDEEEKTVRKKAFEISYNALRADRFQGERRRTLNRLFTVDVEEAKAAARELLGDSDFILYDGRNNNNFSAAIFKLMEFYGVEDIYESPKLVKPGDFRKAFRRWLRDDQGMTESMSDDYVRIVSRAQKFASCRGLSSKRLYTADFAEAKATMNALYRNAEFAQRDRDQEGRFHKALAKLMDFYDAGGASRPLVKSEPQIETQAPVEVAPASVAAPREYTRDADGFQRWLVDARGVAEATSKQIVSAIKRAERFAIDRRLASLWLFTDSVDKAKATAKALFGNPGFIEYDRAQNGRFSRAIARLMEFYGEGGAQSVTRAAEAPSIFTRSDARQASPEGVAPSAGEATGGGSEVDALFEILAERFSNGFRLDSGIHMKRLRRYYEEKTGKELGENVERVFRSALTRRGIVVDGMFYVADAMLSEETREKILDYIAERFDQGATAVYYDALLKKFSDDLLHSPLYDQTEALKAYLEFYVGSQCAFRKKYFTADPYGKADPNAEIREVLKERGVPMDFDELCAILEHIDVGTIQTTLWHNLEFVRNGKGEFFHADSLELSRGELDGIADLIESEIAERDHLTGAELCELIRRKFPNAYERNEVFSESGWRDAIKYKLEGQFSFFGDLVSSAGDSKSRSDVFTEFAKTKQAFSLEELEKFASDHNTPISFDALYTNIRRVSYDKFVAKDELEFNVPETDAVLAQICAGNYVSFSDIVEYSVFPEASHPWNEYLLEQYVAFYSGEFALLRGGLVGFNKSSVVGAIVRKSRRYENFDALAAEILADSGVPLTKNDALDYLVDNGFISRRRLGSIETILLNAQAKRNRERN